MTRFHPFGCTASVLIPKETHINAAHLKKLVGQAKLGPMTKFGIHFGYTDTGYYIYMPGSKKIIVSGKLKFNDKLTFQDFVECEKIPKFVEIDRTTVDDFPEDYPTSPRIDVHIPEDIQSVPPDGGSDLEVGENVLINDLGYALTMLTMNKNRHANNGTLGDNVLQFIAQAVSGPFRGDWISAMNRELDSHKENGTWIVVPKPKNTNIIKML